MTACPACSGIADNVLACGDMCANVMKGCLAQYAALDMDWNQFVGEQFRLHLPPSLSLLFSPEYRAIISRENTDHRRAQFIVRVKSLWKLRGIFLRKWLPFTRVAVQKQQIFHFKNISKIETTIYRYQCI